jgi:hypothetical protein
MKPRNHDSLLEQRQGRERGYVMDDPNFAAAFANAEA